MAESGPADAGTPSDFPEFDAEPAAAAPPSENAPAPADAPAKAAGDGKDGAETKETEVTPADAGPKPEEGEAADEAAEPEPGPFSFAGRTFKDSAAAEHYLKSQEGRAKAEAKRVAAQAKRATDAEASLTEAVRAATYYKAEYEKNARPQETKPTEAKAAEKPWLETLDWGAVRKLAETEGTDAAMFYALQQADGHMTKAFESKLEAALAPYKQADQAQKVQNHTLALFQAAEDFAEQDGTPVYPELREGPETNAEIAKIWVTLDPKFALTEQGVDYAILRFRAQRAGQKPSRTPAPSGASDVVRHAAAAKNKPAEDLNGGGVPRTADDSDAKARFKRSLVETGRPVMSREGESLGFME